MLIAFASFVAGLFFAPIVRPLIKPLFIEIIKVSYSAMEEAKRATAKAKEDLADVVASAEREIIAEEKAKEASEDKSPPPKHH